MTKLSRGLLTSPLKRQLTFWIQRPTTEYLNEKSETCQTDTVQTIVAILRKLQEGLYAMNWIKPDLVSADWRVEDDHQPRGPYAPDETAAIWQLMTAGDPAFEQALRFILSSGACIDEVLHLRADKVSLPDKKVELIGSGRR